MPLAPSSTISDPLGLYIHVPFCARQCDFCAFYQEKPDRSKIERYLSGIEKELALAPPPRAVHTVFMGGGTPTLLSADDLARLCGLIRSYAGDHIAEWSIEIAPATLKPDKLDVLLAAGVNRFSLGVQSFSAATLEAIGRPHTQAQVLQAIDMLSSRVANWNIDLIFAASADTLPGWLADLDRTISFGPAHISTYCLTFESDTKLFAKMLKGQHHRPSLAEERRFYLATWAHLAAAGYSQYEVSNFARHPGLACQHNLNTWRMYHWLGYGPSAAEQRLVADTASPIIARRATNVADLDSWASALDSGRRQQSDIEELSAVDLRLDALVFGLRLREGVDLRAIQGRLGAFDSTQYHQLGQLALRLVAEGLLHPVVEDRWVLSDDGMLLADRIGSEILSIAD